MEKCDSFWQWGNVRKKFSSAEISGAAHGFSKISSVAGGSSLKFPKEEGLLKGRQCMDAASIRRSQRISQGNALKSGPPCRNIELQVQSLTMENNLSKLGDLIEANSSKSPISVVQGVNVSSSSETCTSNSDTNLCYPQGDLRPELDCYRDILVRDRVFCAGKKPSVWRKVQKAGHEQSSLSSDEGIHNSYTGRNREISMEDSSSCSVSKAEAEDMQWKSWFVNGAMRNMRPTGSEDTSSYKDFSSKRPKRSQSLICKSSFEIQKEESEVLFEALHMLADIAVRGMVPSFEEKDKASSDQWVRKEICHPTGVSFWQKRVIRRAKNAFKSVSPNVSGEKPMPTASKLLLTNELGSSGCLKLKENQVMDGGVADKDQGAIQSVRCSKRSRSQFLNSKYSDSVLQLCKRGTKK